MGSKKCKERLEGELKEIRDWEEKERERRRKRQENGEALFSGRYSYHSFIRSYTQTLLIDRRVDVKAECRIFT